jgi:hypothetical protein
MAAWAFSLPSSLESAVRTARLCCAAKLRAAQARIFARRASAALTKAGG